MSRSFMFAVALLLGLAISAQVIAVPTQIRLIGITGKQNTGESGIDPNDDKLFEINITNAGVTPLVKLPFVPDTTAIGFNPQDGLLYRTAGSGSYRNDPNRIAFNDNHYMQTVDVYSQDYPQVGIFNANAQGDTGFGPYGLPAPRPTFILPAERRTDDQTDSSFQQDGPNEYHALRDLTWSSSENLFYGADERGIYKLTPEGESTFVGKPEGLDPKGITFFTVGGERKLLLGDKRGSTLSTIDPMTGQVVGDPVTLLNEAMQPLASVVSLVEHPDGTTLYGISNILDGDDSLARELIRINPVTGMTTAIGILDTGDAFMADLAFVFIDAPVIHTWNIDANGNWSTAANWTNGEPNAVGEAASFAGVITAPRTVTVDGPKTVGSLTFDNAQSYTLAGAGPLTINSNAAATINVVNGSHTISAPLSIAAGKTVTKSGAGTLTISGTQTHGAGAVLVASAGTTNLDSDAGTNLSLQANAAVNLGATQHLGGVQIGAGATLQVATGPSKSLVTPTLTIAGTPAAPTGKLDLTTNSGIVNYTGTSPADSIRQQILAGRGGAGLGKTWNGQGITSSAAAAAEAETRSVGYAENATMPLGAYTNFRGQPVDDTTVIMAFTRTGDANLDGVVNDDDVTIVGATYAPGVAGGTWARGDFDYNGFVDDDDVTLLGVFYDPSAAPLIAPPAEPGANGVAAVPEPGTVALLITGLLGILLAVVPSKARQG
jgi:autotransporter-associated beta strand protein